MILGILHYHIQRPIHVNEIRGEAIRKIRRLSNDKKFFFSSCQCDWTSSHGFVVSYFSQKRMKSRISEGFYSGTKIKLKSRPEREHTGVKHRPDSEHTVATFGGTSSKALPDLAWLSRWCCRWTEAGRRQPGKLHACCTLFATC